MGVCYYLFIELLRDGLLTYTCLDGKQFDRKEKIFMSMVGVRIPKSKGGIISLVVIVIVIVGTLVVLPMIGSVNVQTDSDGIVAKGTFAFKTTVKYGDIKNVEMTDTFDIGHKDSGMSTSKLAAGTFKNDEFGSYKIYANRKCPKFIIITTKDNGKLVVNKETAAKTQALYQQIKKNAP